MASPPSANEPVISFVRRMNTSPTAPIGSRPISEATNGAAAPEARSAVTKPGGRRGGGGETSGRSVGVVAIAPEFVAHSGCDKRFGSARIHAKILEVIPARQRPKAAVAR